MRFVIITLLGLTLQAAVPPKGLAGASKVQAQKIHEGVVEDLIRKDQFVYLKIGTQWFAVVDQEVKKGIKIKLLEQVSLDNFHSKQLNRTFKRLIFAKIAA